MVTRGIWTLNYPTCWTTAHPLLRIKPEYNLYIDPSTPVHKKEHLITLIASCTWQMSSSTGSGTLAKAAEPFVCGGAAASFASCVIHPIDLAKVWAWKPPSVILLSRQSQPSHLPLPDAELTLPSQTISLPPGSHATLWPTQPWQKDSQLSCLVAGDDQTRRIFLYLQRHWCRYWSSNGVWNSSNWFASYFFR